MRTTASALIVASLAACGSPPTTAPIDAEVGAGTEVDASAALDLAASLPDSIPFRGSEVGARLGASLTVTDTSNPSFTVYRGGPSGPFSEIEVREPTTASDKGGMVLLAVSSPCLTRADVGERFGQRAPGPSVQSPHGPPQPVYEAYPQSWGTLSLGYGPSDECLRQIVLDAIR